MAASPYAEYLWNVPGRRCPDVEASHIEWRDRVRRWTEKHITPHVGEWDESYGPSGGYKPLLQQLYRDGLTPFLVGVPSAWKWAGIKPPKNYNAFHGLIGTDEMMRCGSPGIIFGMSAGLGIGLAPILERGTLDLKNRVAPAVLRGEQTLCLCITEPWAGSDVAGLRTTATLTPCGKFYEISGTKKWITNGVWADLFTVACRTGDAGSGQGGVSLVLVERSRGGVSTERIQCMGAWASGTAFVHFNKVRVPVENLIGREGKGFTYVMENFNHERWAMVAQAMACARLCYSQAFSYALRRKTFGKALIRNQGIRLKLAEMARRIASCQNWLLNITRQMDVLGARANAELGGEIALLKVQATEVYDWCAKQACQVFGGASYTRSGVGSGVEKLYRAVKMFAIGGGSEEIMSDFAIRNALRRSRRSKL